jgi:hypothetical protein
MEGSTDPADVDGLCGLPDGDRLRTRCSQCAIAPDAPAEYHDQGSSETHDECAKASRSHAPIVAARPIFDK